MENTTNTITTKPIPADVAVQRLAAIGELKFEVRICNPALFNLVVTKTATGKNISEDIVRQKIIRMLGEVIGYFRGPEFLLMFPPAVMTCFTIHGVPAVDVFLDKDFFTYALNHISACNFQHTIDAFDGCNIDWTIYNDMAEFLHCFDIPEGRAILKAFGFMFETCSYRVRGVACESAYTFLDSQIYRYICHYYGHAEYCTNCDDGHEIMSASECVFCMEQFPIYSTITGEQISTV